MTPTTFELGKLIEFGVGLCMKKAEQHLGELGMNEHIGAIATELGSHLGLPASVEIPMPLELVGRLAWANYQRQQRINQSWANHNDNSNE